MDYYIDSYDYEPPKFPIEVILYSSDNFQNVVAGGPTWAEGLFDGRLRIPIRSYLLKTKDLDPLKIVLRHELSHALLSLMSDARQLPSWFDEGLAQWLSCGNQGCTSYKFTPTPEGFLSTLAFNTPFTSYGAIKASQAYRQSLYIIQFIEKKWGRVSLRQMIRQISPSCEISSDYLLLPLRKSFRQLRELAKQEWDQRETFMK